MAECPDKSKHNSLTALMAAFSCPGRPVNAAEFRVFWADLTDVEKEYYLHAEI
jgi:hypothetical protein